MKSRQGSRSVKADPIAVIDARNAKGWTQERLAQKAGYHKRTVEHIEAGKPVFRETLLAIADALDKQPDQLLQRQDPAHSQATQNYVITPANPPPSARPLGDPHSSAPKFTPSIPHEMPQSGGLWPLSTELLQWSRQDSWTLAQAVEGTLITGATGSGKTSGPFQTIIRSLLRINAGGLFLCAKQDSVGDYLKLAALEGRGEDIITVSIDDGEAFDFLTYEAQRHGVGKVIVENIVKILMEAHEVSARKGNHQGDDFFHEAMQQLLRNCLEVVTAATGQVDLATVLGVVQTLPQSSQDARMPEGLLALELLEQAERNAPQRARELEMARSYFVHAWPQLADRTRTSIAITLSVLLDRFLRYPIRDLLLSPTSCSPDDILAGKIVILDVPVKEFDHIAKVVGVIWKYSLQRAIERRFTSHAGNPDSLRPVFIAADESQFWATRQDTLFQQTARAARGITVYASQSLANFYAELGADPTGKAHVESFLGNLQTRLACQNSEPETNEWYARTIGRTKQHFTSWSFNPWTSLPTGKTRAEHIDYDVQPRMFTTLKNGGPSNRYCVEAILTRAGQPFRATGQRWLKVRFDQNPKPGWSRWWGYLSSSVRITAPLFRTFEENAGRS